MLITKGIAIPVRPIKESSNQEKTILQQRIDRELEATRSNLFSNLSENQKMAVRKNCSKKLKNLEKRSFSDILCFSQEKSVGIHKGFYSLMDEIKDRCLQEPGIFRKEGDRTKTREIVHWIIQERPVDFSEYPILVLGSAFKSYIRDHLDGTFDTKFLDLILEYLKQHKYKESDYASKLFIFSLSPEMRILFGKIQEILFKISENFSHSKMNMESLVNILCLTFTPQCFFNNLEVVDYLKIFLRNFIRLDLNDMEALLI